MGFGGESMTKLGSGVENPYYQVIDGRVVPTDEGRRQIGLAICRAYKVKPYEVIDHSSPGETAAEQPPTLAVSPDMHESGTR